jgi:hypothetical protein
MLQGHLFAVDAWTFPCWSIRGPLPLMRDKCSAFGCPSLCLLCQTRRVRRATYPIRIIRKRALSHMMAHNPESHDQYATRMKSWCEGLGAEKTAELVWSYTAVFEPSLSDNGGEFFVMMQHCPKN